MNSGLGDEYGRMMNDEQQQQPEGGAKPQLTSSFEVQKVKLQQRGGD